MQSSPPPPPLPGEDADGRSLAAGAHIAASDPPQQHLCNKPLSPPVTVPTPRRKRPTDDKQRGVNANHLLNFSLPPRQQRPAYNNYASPHRNKGKASAAASPYLRDRFVNANFRFLVSSLGNYDANVIDPDATIAWNDVEQVIIPSTDGQACPICLSGPPVAPKVSRCGHVFCFSCALHHLTVAEKVRQRCPICHEAMSAPELKSARIMPVRDYSRWTEKSHAEHEVSREFDCSSTSSSGMLVMKAFKRSSGSMVALPRVSWGIWAMEALPLCDSDGCAHIAYAKVLVASTDYLQTVVLGKEQRDLAAAIEVARSSGEELEVEFLQTALSLVEQRCLELVVSKPARDTRYAAVKRARAPAPASSLKHQGLSLPTDGFLLPPGQLSAMETEVDVKASTADLSTVATSHRTTRRDPSASPNTAVSNDDGFYYFYQSADGQLLFLHPLDVKILKDAYGAYSSFPDEICVKISVIEESTLDEELRKRYRYLGHLPLASDVSFCEIDWASEKNVCRTALTPSTVTSPLSSPSIFISSAAVCNSAASCDDDSSSSAVASSKPVPLVDAATLRKWKADIKARSKRRIDKIRREEKKDEARRRHNSFSVQSPPTHPSDPMADHVASVRRSSVELESGNQNLAVSTSQSSINNEVSAPRWGSTSAPPIFDFDDETHWKPLGSGSVTATANMATNTPPRRPRPGSESTVPDTAPLSTVIAASSDASAHDTMDSAAAAAALSPTISFADVLSGTAPALPSSVSEADALLLGASPVTTQHRKGKKKNVVVLMSTASSHQRAPR